MRKNQSNNEKLLILIFFVAQGRKKFDENYRNVTPYSTKGIELR